MTLHDVLLVEIRRLAQERIEHQLETLLNPAAITSHADYLRVTATITTLRDTLPEILEEAVTNINKR